MRSVKPFWIFSIFSYLIAATYFSSCTISGSVESLPSPKLVAAKLISPFVESGTSTIIQAEGGVPPYIFKIESGNGTLQPISGDQTSLTSDQSGTVAVSFTDSEGNTSKVEITFVQPIVITPGSGSIAAFTNQSFSAAGGLGALTFSLVDGLGGFIDSLSGHFTRPWAAGEITVKVTDTVGISKTAKFELAKGSIATGGTAWDDAWYFEEDSEGNIFTMMATSEAFPEFTNAGSADAVFVKLNPAGQILWKRFIGTSGYDYASEMFVDSAGDLYLTFQHHASASWGTGDLAGGKGCNLIKLNGEDGAVHWVKTIAATIQNFCRYNTMAEGNSGEIYMAGMSYAGSVQGGTSSGVQDSYLLRMNKQTGATDWIRFTGVTTNYQTSVHYDSATDRIYLAGMTDGTFPGKSNIGGRNFWVVQYDSSGNRYWHDQWGTADGWTDLASRSVIGANGVAFCGYTGWSYPTWYHTYPSLLILSKEGTRILERKFEEVRNLNTNDGVYSNCFAHGDGFIFSFASKLAPTGFVASGGGAYDTYYFKYNFSGQIISQHQIKNTDRGAYLYKTLSDGSIVGVVDSGKDLVKGGVPATSHDSYVLRISELGAAPQWGAVGMTGATSGNHYWDDFFVSSANEIYLWISTDGSLDGLVNKGQNDAILTKFNLKLERQ